jgi:signal transduction histidine kinase
MLNRELLDLSLSERLKSAALIYQERAQSVNRELPAPPAGAIELLSHLLQKITEAVFLIDLDGVILVANESAQKMVQRKRDGLVLQKFWSVFPDGYFGFSMRESLRYGIAQARAFQTLYGREVEISTSFLYVGTREQHRLVVMLSDLTERQKFQQVLARTDRMKELGEMAAALAHEIRNPLGAVRGFAMLLVRDLVDNPHLQKMAQHIIEGTKALETVVTSVLQYARPIQVAPRTIDLGEKLKELAKFAKTDPAFPQNVKLILHIPDEPVLVPVDPESLKSALLNLLINAWQAMPRGGTISVSLLKLNTTCQITLTDTGIGIPEETLSRLFSPLFTTKQAGNGLGLVETKKIVEAHGGTIDVRSRAGAGTTFTITLSLQR